MFFAHTHRNALPNPATAAPPYKITQIAGDFLSSKGATKLVIQESKDKVFRQSREAIRVAFEILEIVEELLVQSVYVVACQMLPVSCKESIHLFQKYPPDAQSNDNIHWYPPFATLKRTMNPLIVATPGI